MTSRYIWKEIMHQIIKENFLEAFEVLMDEEIDNETFNFCLDTIKTTLIYIESKRKNKEKICQKACK